jgi:hypothetical protein
MGATEKCRSRDIAVFLFIRLHPASEREETTEHNFFQKQPHAQLHDAISLDLAERLKGPARTSDSPSHAKEPCPRTGPPRSINGEPIERVVLVTRVRPLVFKLFPESRSV